MTRARRKTKMEVRAAERAEWLRAIYSAPFCVCGGRKAMREPFCRSDMQTLGRAGAPRPLLRGEFDDPATAEAWEACLEVLKEKGYVKPGVTLMNAKGGHA